VNDAPQENLGECPWDFLLARGIARVKALKKLRPAWHLPQ